MDEHKKQAFLDRGVQVVLRGNDYVEAENEARADAKVNHVYWCQKMQKHTEY